MAVTVFDSTCARCRRAGEKLFLKGDKCGTPKCPMVRRPYAPGAHGAAGPSRRRGGKRSSDFAVQLSQKQSLRAIYGLRDRQLKNYYERALRKEGVTGDILLSLLESRLDNVVYRLGYARSRTHARQLVGHRMFSINGRSVNIPSRLVKQGDEISIKESKRDKGVFVDLEERLANHTVPSWLERKDQHTAHVIDAPSLEQAEMPVDVRAVVEFYSR